MSEYKQLIYTAAEIDERLGRVDKLSNPNLLINPFFQINQWGQSSYSGGRYTVDRWRLAATAATLSVLSDGIKIDATSGAGYYNQRLENPLTVGRTYTFSVKDDAGDIYVFTAVAKPEYMGQQATPWGDIRIEYLSSTQSYYATVGVDTGKTATIKAAKLELGEISTLANDVPSINEIDKCKRYFRLWKTDAARTAALQEVGLMRLENPTLGTINIGGTTYYTASAEQ